MAAKQSTEPVHTGVDAPIPPPTSCSTEKTEVDPESPSADVSPKGIDQNSPAQEEEAVEDGMDYPKGMKLVLIMISLFLAMFLVALVCYDPTFSISF
jgi:hypothetical protein